MKVKLKKHKKSPAPCVTEQVKVKSTIETLRNARAYRVPIHVIYDRGYKQTIDLASVIQKTNKKIPAPLVAKQDEMPTLNKLRKRILRFGVPNLVKVDDTCNFLAFNDASYVNLKEIQARIQEIKQSIRHHLH